MEVMAYGTPISIFTQRVKEPSNDNKNVRFTNGLVIQVAIYDPKKSGVYTETLSKAMKYFNENGSHPILSSKVGKSAVIDKDAFRKLIQMQNEDLRRTKHVEMHNLSHIDKDISLGYDTTGEIINSTIRQMLMDEVDVEGEPIFHVIERTMKNKTDRAPFLEPNNNLCMTILDDLEIWIDLLSSSSMCLSQQRRDHVSTRKFKYPSLLRR
jgi:hypothetical protein